MAQTRRGRTPRNTTNRIRNAARENLYIYDSAARDLQVRRQLEEAPRKRLSNETRKNRDKALHMNLGYVFFLLGAVCVCAVVLLNYLQLQSDITTKVKNISRLESTLNTKQLANEEEYNRIISSLDLENIRKIAIGELGMSYAQEGQIITYESTGYDYMRRVSE
ncbi:MAG: cell division protein FtsL [Acetatifactor sp.]|nr:cell division protein FtsL [Acetatifactor sp.]MDE6701446.1 cell division protein FtsL [Acetatifactor sp.]MDE7114257.1 cell division protein FtsL [Acetatifactor sp.]